MNLTDIQQMALETAPTEQLEEALLWSVEVISSWDSLEELLNEGIWKEIMSDCDAYHKAKEQIAKMKEVNGLIKQQITKRKGKENE